MTLTFRSFVRLLVLTLGIPGFAVSVLADWQLVSGGLPADTEIVDVEVAPGGSIFAATASAVYRSDDGGSSWQSKLTTAGTFARIAAYDGVVFATAGGGADPGMFRSLDNGENWTTTGIGTGTGLREMARVDGDTYLAAKLVPTFGDTGVLASFDGGASWEVRNNGLPATAYIPGFGNVYEILDVEAIGNNWYAAVGTFYGEGIFRSQNNGLSWSVSDNGLQGPDNRAVVEDIEALGDDLYIINNGALWKSEDFGESWTQVFGELGFSVNYLQAEGNTLYLVGSTPLDNVTRVYVTTDGINFQRTIATGLCVGNAVAPVASDGSTIWVAGAEGLYSLDLGTDPLEAIPPAIANLGGAGTYLVGQPTELFVEAVGTAPLSYQWRKDGTDIPGATGATLELNDLQLADAGTYTVVVTNAGGSETSDELVLEVVDATPGAPDPSFTVFQVWDDFSSSFTDSSLPYITELITRPDGKVWVSGKYNQSDNGYTPSEDNRSVKRLNPDGTIDGVNDGIGMTNYAIALEADRSLLSMNYRGQMVRTFPDGTDDLFATAQMGAADGRIYDVLVLPDGRIVIAGEFDNIKDRNLQNPVFRNNIAILNPDGSVDESFDAGDTFRYGSHLFAIEYDAARQRIYAAGEFQDWAPGGRDSLVALNLDGSLDTSFANDALNLPSSGGQGLALQADGRILLGLSRTGGGFGLLTRFHPDGTVDSSFDPGTGPNAAVLGIEIAPDGKIFVLGEFGLFDGVAKNYLAVLEQDGSLVEAFNPGGNGPGGVVMDVAFSADGRSVYVAMDGYIYRTADETFTYDEGFYEPRGVVLKLQNFIANLAVLNQPDDLVVDQGDTATFEVDLFTSSTAGYQWFKDGQPLSGETGATLEITNADTDDGGSYFVRVTNSSGSVTSEAASLLVRAEPAFLSNLPGLVDADQGDDLTLSVEAIGLGGLTYQWYKDGVAIAGATDASYTLPLIQPDDSGTYYVEVTGDLGTTTSAPSTVTVQIAGGNVDPSFTGPFADRSVDSFLQVGSLLVRQDGSLIAYGTGSGTLPDQSTVSYLLSINADGSIDQSSPLNEAPNGAVFDVEELADGSLLIAGAFSSFDGTAVSRLVKVAPDGTVDSGFTPAQINSTVQEILVQPDGKLIIRGSFTSVGGQTRNRIARLNADGSLDETYLDGLAGPGLANLGGAAFAPDGGLVVWGSFTSFNADATRKYLVKLNDDGTLDQSFPVFDFYVRSGSPLDGVFFFDDGDYLLYGNFTQINGVNQQYIVRVNPDGTLDNANFIENIRDPQTYRYPVPERVTQVVRPLGSDGFLVVGNFASWQGNTVTGIAEIDAQGNYVPGFAERLSFSSVARGYVGPGGIVLDEPGFAYLIGGFDNVGGHDTSFWARIYLDPVGLAITGQPEDQYVEPGTTATFEVEALGSSEISYEWYKDGVRIPGESSSILSIAGVGEGDEGLYTARVFNAAGVEFTAPARLIVLGAPVVVAHPQSVVAESGEDVSLSGNVIGASPFSLQWLKDGSPLSGATGPTLSLSGVSAADAGLYQLRGTNGSGEATTFAASLSIEMPAPGVDETFLSQVDDRVIKSIEILPDGRFLIAGSFGAIGGADTDAWAIVNPDGSVDTTFETESQYNLNDMIPLPDGRFAGANFSGLVIYNADGTQSGTTLSMPGSLNADRLERMPNGKILVIGFRGELALVNADLTLDTSFTAPSFSGYYGIHDAAVDSQNRIIILGSGDASDGTTTQRGIVRVDQTGTIDPSFDAGTGLYNSGTDLDNRVMVDSNDRIIVSGRGYQYNGQSVESIFRLNGDGSLDSSFTQVAVGNSSNRIAGLVELSTGKYGLVGGFQTLNGISRPYAARLNADGSVDSQFAPQGLSYRDSPVIAADDAGGFVAGGLYVTIDGESYENMVGFAGDPEPLEIVAGPEAQSIAPGEPFRFAAASVGVGPLEFQWQRDGVDITGATDPQYGKDSAANEDLGTYSVVVLDGASGNDSGSATLDQGGASPIESWAAGFGLSGADAEADADSDKDGKPNLLEYAMGTDPSEADGGNAPVVGTLPAADLRALHPDAPVETGKRYLVVQFWKKSSTSGFTITPRYATSLAGLSGADDTGVLQAGPPQIEGGFEVHTYYYSTAIEDSSEDAGFMQLLLSLD